MQTANVAFRCLGRVVLVMLSLCNLPHALVHAQENSVTRTSYNMTLLNRQTLLLADPVENSVTRYENGFFTQVHRNLQGGSQGNVYVWDKTGALLWNPRLSLTPGDQVALSSISITSNHVAVVAGYSVGIASPATYFIAENTIGSSAPFHVIKLGRFLPTQACATDDATLWVIGSLHQPKQATPVLTYATLRHYSVEGIVLGRYLPRAALSTGFETAYRSESQTYLRCTGAAVALVSGENSLIATASTAVPKPSVGSLQLGLVQGQTISGFAYLPNGQLFVSVRSTHAGTTGPRLLMALVPSSGALVTYTGSLIGGGPSSSTWPLQSSIVRLVGSDGTSLVYFEHAPKSTGTTRVSWVRFN